MNPKAKRRVQQAPVLLCLMVLALLPAAGQQGVARTGSPAASSAATFTAAASNRVPPEAIDAAPDSRLEPATSQYGHAGAGSLPGDVQFSQTPFEQRISMPLAGLWHGHMQVTGFASFDSMENVLWGPPASGNLSARGVTSQSHVGVWAPDQNQSYGLTLTLHRKAPDALGRSVNPERWLARMLRLGRT